MKGARRTKTQRPLGTLRRGFFLSKAHPMLHIFLLNIIKFLCWFPIVMLIFRNFFAISWFFFGFFLLFFLYKRLGMILFFGSSQVCFRDPSSSSSAPPLAAASSSFSSFFFSTVVALQAFFFFFLTMAKRRRFGLFGSKTTLFGQVISNLTQTTLFWLGFKIKEAKMTLF